MGGSRSKLLLRRIRVLDTRQKSQSLLKDGPSPQLREFLNILANADPGDLSIFFGSREPPSHK
jgi:hypothetical protein